MELLFLLFIFIFQLSNTFASPTNEFILGGGGEVGETAVPMATSFQSDEKGYECGNVFFRDSEVEVVLLTAFYSLKSQFDIQEYHGPLYDDTEIPQYFLYPIKKGKRVQPTTRYNQGVNFIVFRKDKEEVIDIITRITNNHFTKCIRKDNSQTEQLVLINKNTNGYQCGHDFISDHAIQKSTHLAREKIGGDTNFPAPYVGRLFPENGEYMIWPIFSRRRLYSSGNEDGGPYFLIINREGGFIDVVVKGYHKNFLRCTRSKNITKVSESDLHGRLTVSAPRAGFQCGKAFFDFQILNQAAGLAKSVTFYKYHKQFPTKYSGPPFNEPCLLWPIFSDGSLYRKGRGGPYRVVLSLDFRVINAVMINNDNKISVCERAVIEGEKNHDQNNYYCNGFYFTYHMLASAAELGCMKFNIGTRGNRLLYPARYEGPRFEKEGPYLTYPVYLNNYAYGGKRKRPGRFRVVMNHACEVVGALSMFKDDNSEKRLVKCERVKDAQTIELSPYDTNEPISEHRVYIN